MAELFEESWDIVQIEERSDASTAVFLLTERTLVAADPHSVR